MVLDGIAQAAAPKRVVLFGSYAPSLINFRGPLIAALVERGHEVFALAPDIDDALIDQIRTLGAHPVAVPIARGSIDPRRARRTESEIRSIFRSLRPDVVIAYTIAPIVLSAEPAREVGAQFIPMVTGLGYAFLGGAHPKRLLVRLAATAMYKRAFRRAQFAFFQNEDDRRDFKRLRILPPQLPTALINGSGVNLSDFDCRPLPKKPSFLMVSRFLKDKGIREYGAAAARLKREFPAAHFSLAGWRDQSPDAIGATELHAMQASGVELLGQLADVRPAIESSRVYVLPSYREGTPRSVLEAMAMGRPIVTTDVPGCRETVIEGENGFLVPPADVEALYLAMRRFLETPAIADKMGLASRLIAEKKFDVDSVNRAIIGHAGL